MKGLTRNLRTANDYAGLYNCMGVRCIDNNEGITTSIKFTFLTPTNGFAFNFGASDSIWVLNAYNSANELLGSVDAPVTLSSNSGDYIGLQFASSSISYATLILGTFDYIFIDIYIFFGSLCCQHTRLHDHPKPSYRLPNRRFRDEHQLRQYEYLRLWFVRCQDGGCFSVGGRYSVM